MYPTKKQKLLWNNCFDAYRFVYNKTLHFINEYYSNKNKFPTIKETRSNVINGSVCEEKYSWLLKYPYDFRDEALRDCRKNYKSNFAKIKKNDCNKKFQIKFKSKKYDNNNNCSISILHKHLNRKSGFWFKFFKGLKIRDKRTKEKYLSSKCNMRLLRTCSGKFYFVIPYEIDIVKEKPQINSVISIDPGIRDFITGYDPINNKVISIGNGISGHISRLLHNLNKIKSKLAKKKKNKYRIKLAYNRARERISNMISDLHNKTIKYLLSNYDLILIPKLNFHNFKAMNKKTKAKFATLSHCKFIEKMKTKSISMNKIVISPTEEYTSKTCSNCGILNRKLGANKNFKCDKCGLEADRDINASKNILLKFISEFIDNINKRCGLTLFR